MEDVSYAQTRALSDKFSSLETDVLISMWGNEQRLPWADALLRSELRNRGFDSHYLDEVLEQRPTDPIYSSTIDDKISARLLAFFAATGAGVGSGALFGYEIGLLIAGIVIAAYAAYLWHSIPRELRVGKGQISHASLVYDALKFSALAGAVLYAAIAQLLAHA